MNVLEHALPVEGLAEHPPRDHPRSADPLPALGTRLVKPQPPGYGFIAPPGRPLSGRRFESIPCEIDQTLEGLEDGWAQLIGRDVVQDACIGLLRCSELQDNVAISKDIPSDRLPQRLDHPAQEQTRLPESGQRGACTPTTTGRDLRLIPTTMRLWAERRVLDPEDMPLALPGR